VRVPLEIALIGIELTLIRLAVTFFFPVLLGLIINGLFPNLTGRIRRDAEALQAGRGKGGATHG